MKQHLLFLSMLTVLSACQKDDPYNVPQPVSNRIRFDALAVGQVSRYIGLNGYGYHPAIINSYFEYTDDTLHLEIVAKDDNGYKVAETVHYVGDVDTWLNGSWADSTFFYYLYLSDDTLRFSPIDTWNIRSRIFRGHATRYGLPLEKITSPEVEIKDWRTSFPSWSRRWEGYTENYTLFGHTYEHLNVIVENTAMALDAPGETYVFSKSFGIVRASTYGYWTSEGYDGYGWDLIPVD